MHSDHIGSLSSLIYYCYYIKHIIINVYFPNNELIEFLAMQGNMEGIQYKFNILNLEESTAIGFIRIKPIAVNHVQLLNCFGYLINLKGKLIWYSGDSSNICNIIDEYEIDEFYQDTCLADYEGNPHTSLRILCENVPKTKRKFFYCMHIDCDELIEKAEKLGFNVVKNKYNKSY